MKADCRLCRYGNRFISEKTDKMVVMLKCDLFDEFIDMKTAVDENAVCDFYEYDDNVD